MKKSIIAATFVALTIGIFADSADAGTPGIDNREHRQAMRIWHGIADGRLNVREARVLWHGQMRIRAAERRFRRDGVVTRHERRRLHRMLNRQSRKIRRFRHN